MTEDQLIADHIEAMTDYVEMLARRRARGEISSLYPELQYTADTVINLQDHAPDFLLPDLYCLSTRCSSIMRSIAN